MKNVWKERRNRARTERKESETTVKEVVEVENGEEENLRIKNQEEDMTSEGKEDQDLV